MSSTQPVEPAGLTYHPLAELFPLLQGKDFDDLVEDIRVNGVLEPVWTYQGQILDGRNRHRAAGVAGREAPAREYTGEDPLSFVISLNMHRRHLSESQRSVIAAKIATLSEGRPPNTAQVGAVSQAQAAELMHVGRRSVQKAKKVITEAAPELVRAVERGEVKVDAAAAVVSAPKEQQAQAAAQGAQAVKELKRSIAKPSRAATLKDDLRKATSDVLHFVQVLRAAKVKPAKFILQPYVMGLMDPKGTLVPFVNACAKAVRAHQKQASAQARKFRARRRAQVKAFRAKQRAKAAKAAAARARASTGARKKGERATTKAAKNAGRVSATRQRSKSSARVSSRSLKRSPVSA